MTDEVERSPRPASPVTAAVEWVGERVLALFQAFIGVLRLAASISRWMVRPPFRMENLFAQFDFVGVGSVPLAP